MPTDVRIAARAVRNSADFVPSILAGRSPVALDISFEPSSALPDTAELVITATELFTQCSQEMRKPVAQLPIVNGSLQMDIAPADLALTPGCWHLRIDAVADGNSLAGADVGSAVVYARRPGESLAHARGSFNLARAEFAWDRTYGIHYMQYRSEIPATGDPFSENNADRHRREFVSAEDTWPELQHDGGLGFLLAACVFDALGEPGRTKYCEKVMKRTVSVITELMAAGDGRLMSVRDSEHKRAQRYHCKQQDGFALKFLAQVYFYFRFGPGSDAAYAADVLARAGLIFKYQIDQPLEPYCGECGCCVYDGRILAGLAWYSLAHRAENGDWPADEAETKVLRFAEVLTRQLLNNHGWYDGGCLVEAQCHIWAGNMNLLNGLLPVRRIIAIDAAQAENIEYHIEQGTKVAFDFLTRTNGSVTGYRSFVPTSTSLWAAGNMYELCDEYLRQVGEDRGVRLLMEDLVLGAGSQLIGCFHRNNTSGAVMMHCQEYRDLEQRPALPWDRPGAMGTA